MFTIPFSREETLSVSSSTPWQMELEADVATDVVAPQHGKVIEVRVGSITIRHWDASAVLVVDDVWEPLVLVGDRLCAGDVIGHSRRARVRAFWDEKEMTDQQDISMVRLVRDHVVINGSDVSAGDRVYSALSLAQDERDSDVDRARCPYRDGE
ncbi:hypothetical protein COV06_04345 [Candidatus Uhrbacteria bacterium CG10_big_fil_rev_8_21_14_0_10_50_16]|uniref:Uncharacterized protein n=1 Tax=Candidatus Uhrbacteria bacterium CG10_big_fil_rev_8_21_14_0_10_50_16 TaxID=1975039 RepID=A0A2H0RNF3_9BACT|nr:MAG: hypothetical protein COV06_04345 [Candidatus Uhrbacteria bacterium CG10_big_fil_rev_8_21_14_0_10_50_16]